MNRTIYDLFCQCGENLSRDNFDILNRTMRHKGDIAQLYCEKCKNDILVTRLGGGKGYKVEKKKLRLKEIKD